MRFVALLALVAALPIVGVASYYLNPDPPPPATVMDGLVKVSTESHYGWVVTAGKYKGQTTDPAIVLQYPKAGRPPAAFKKLTCVVYAAGEPVALSPKAVQVCHAVTVSEAEVLEALGGDSPSPPGVPAMP